MINLNILIYLDQAKKFHLKFSYCLKIIYNENI